MGKHKRTEFDNARDELMSHVVRCQVLDATMEHRNEWLKDTMDFMAERYPGLSDLQIKKLEMVGRQFIQPPIPHGKKHNARSRPDTAEAEGDVAPEAADEKVLQPS